MKDVCIFPATSFVCISHLLSRASHLEHGNEGSEGGESEERKGVVLYLTRVEELMK